MPKKIKIAQVITRLDWGGSPDVVRAICLGADKEKYDVRLITGPSKNLSSNTKFFLEEFKENTFIIPDLKRDISPAGDFKAFIKLFLLFRKEKFGIVHTHTAKAGILGRKAAWLAGVNYIIHTSHGHNFYGYFGAMGSRLVVVLEKIMDIFTSKVIALTELEKEDLVKFKISRPDKIIVFDSGIELDKFKKTSPDIFKKKEEFNIRPGEMVVGMINRLETVKGPEYFIEAAKIISDAIPGVKFLIVGEGSLRKKLESMCRGFGIHDKTNFTGWREDVPEILPVLDLLVLPSLNEAVGRILIEAGACGVPVVAANVGGIPEIVQNNETGLLVVPKSSGDLAEAVISLLKDKNKRIKMGNSAAVWVNNKFNIENLVKNIYGLYSEIYKNKN
ncbi:MAG: glycosyltransferase family 4 protein [bacterium]